MESNTDRKRALIAMSGGVDSSVAAALMLSRGYECIGVTMKLFVNEDVGISKERSCCGLDDVEDARNVAARLGIPFYVCNFSEDFRQNVMKRFIDAYERGETPNPCIDCNRYIKFDRLAARARELQCDYVVTGHYARISFDAGSGRWLLKRGKNAAKDQSYVLCFMTQEQLSRTKFPLGEYAQKEEVRELARRYGFVNAAKHDSQDICFVPDGNYAAFIENSTGRISPEGDFVTTDGRVLGRHKGLIRYTIGQRKGLGLALPAPLYVCRKDLQNNRVVLSGQEGLFGRQLRAGDFNWIMTEPPEPGTRLRITAKPRYRAKEAPAWAAVEEDGTVTVVFDEPQRALTPGQAVVLYDGDTVAGGGTILPD